MRIIKNNLFKFNDIYFWPLKLIMLIVILLILVMSYIIYVNFTIEQSHKIQDLYKEEQNLTKETVKKFQLAKSVDLYLQQLAPLSQLETQVNQQFPSSDDLPQVLIQINQLAGETHLLVTSLVPLSNEGIDQKTQLKLNDIANNAKIMIKQFNFGGTASYQDLMQFVYLIAQFPRVIRLSDLQLNRIADDKISITLTLTIYYTE